jgi:hypothetical protein
MIRFYGKAVDRVFGIILIALFSVMLLLLGSLLVNVNDEVRHDETILKAGTLLQRQTVYVFDRGSIWGYKFANQQCKQIIQFLQLARNEQDHQNDLKKRKFHPRRPLSPRKIK